LTFKVIGKIDCPDAGADWVTALAIARDGTAYINNHGHSLWKIDTKNASCAPTTYQYVSGPRPMGLAFSSDIAGGTHETLYASLPPESGISHTSLAKIELPTFQTVGVGDFTNGLDTPTYGSYPTFTGTGDGRLFGVFPNGHGVFAETDKASGATP